MVVIKNKEQSARPQRLVLELGRAERHYWRDLWAYRDLFAILAWRDIAVRYKQTIVGIAWAVVRPFLTMVVFTLVFGRLARLPSVGSAPYPIMVFAGLLPWFLFSTILSEASNSIVSNSNLVGKIYFPRIIIPTSSAVVALVDFCINVAMLFALMIWYGFAPSWRILLLPCFVALAIFASLGPALWITALNVKYRDFRYINPVVGVIDGFRWSLLGGESTLYIPGFICSLGVVAFFLWFGIAYFRRTERSFADLI
jgi:lipopolysaccharide transport system permease protein